MTHDEQTTTVGRRPRSRRPVFRTEAERQVLMAEYERWDGTQISFCEAYGVAPRTLKGWFRKHNPAAAAISGKPASFVEFTAAAGCRALRISLPSECRLERSCRERGAAASGSRLPPLSRKSGNPCTKQSRKKPFSRIGLNLETTPACGRRYVFVNRRRSRLRAWRVLRLGQAPTPGQLRRFDHENRRNGTANPFVALATHRGWRKDTERRTATDLAACMRELRDVHFPEADRIRVVLDNLSTHTPAVPCNAQPTEEARRILRRIEFHYTPKHASWLNMVEIEIGVLQRQCQPPDPGPGNARSRDRSVGKTEKRKQGTSQLDVHRRQVQGQHGKSLPKTRCFQSVRQTFKITVTRH